MQTNDLTKVLETLLSDAYDTEKKMGNKLSSMAEKASNIQIKNLIEDHVMETKNQMNRLERAFELGDIENKHVGSPIIDSMLEEGETLFEGCEEGPVRDAALLVALQRIQHHEIATYGSIISLARASGLPQVADLLEESLDEEYASDKTMTEMADRFINVQAYHEQQASA